MSSTEPNLSQSLNSATPQSTRCDDAESQVDSLEQQLSGLKDLFRKQAILQLETQRAQAAIRERDEHLAAKEREVTDLRLLLDAKANELQQASEKLTHAREEHARASEALESTLSELESREAALAQRETRVQEQLTDITDRIAAITTGEKRLQEHEATVDSAAQAVAAEHSRLEEAQRNHTDAASKLNSEREQLETTARELATIRVVLAEETTSLECKRKQLSDEAQALQAKHELLETQQSALAEREESYRAQLITAQENVAAHLQAREQAESELNSQNAAHSAAMLASQEQLATLHDQLTKLTSLRNDLQQSLTTLTTAHQSSIENLATSNERNAEIQRTLELEKQAAAALSSRLDELTKQYDELQSSFAATTSQRDSLITRLARLETEFAELAAVAADVNSATEQSIIPQSLTQPQASITGSQSGDNSSETSRELENQLSAARAEAHELRTQLSLCREVFEEYESLWEHARSESTLNSTKVSELTADVTELEQVVEALKDRLRASTLQVKELTQRLSNSAAVSTSVQTKPTLRLERRRARLDQYKLLLKAQAQKVRRASEAVQKRYEQVEQVLAIRADLAAARVRIIHAETRANRRNAVTRSAAAVMCMTITMAVVGALSWAIAREIAPAHFHATSIIKATPGERELTSGELAEWQSLHEGLLTDPRLHEALAERFSRQAVTSLATAPEVGALAKESLSFESTGDGEMKLRLVGKGSDNTARTLEIFTNGLVNFVNSGQIQRVDGATTTITQLSTAGAEPIDHIRTQYALAIGGVGGVLSLLVGSLIWGRLARAKSAFEQDADLDKLLADEPLKA